MNSIENNTKLGNKLFIQLIQFLFIGFCVFFLVLLVSKRAQPFFDFYIFYTAGTLFNSGQDVYNQDLFREALYNIAGHRNFPALWISYAYPPQTTFLFSLLARFPFEIAHKISLYVNFFLLILDSCLIGYILSQEKPLKTVDFCLISSFLLTGFAYENITNSQFGILISILLLCAYIFIQKKKDIPAAISLALTSIKPSFLPFFLVYFIVKRRYLAAVYCLIFSLVFTVTPLLMTGIPIVSTLANWLAVLGSWRIAGTPNYPDPLGKFSFHASMIDLEPLIYRLFNGQTSAAELTLKGITIVVLAYCAWLFLKKPMRDNASLLDFGLISAVAMLFVYHRRYDIFLLFPGLLHIYIRILDQSLLRKFWTCFLCAVLLLISFADLLSTKLSASLVFLQTSYLWKLILPLPWAGIITLAALLFLKTKEGKLDASFKESMSLPIDERVKLDSRLR